MLRIIAFAEPAVAISTVVSGILKGSGDTRWPFYISVIGMWGVRMSLALVLIKIFDFGLIGIWIPMGLDWVARTITGLWRIRGGKWLYIWDKKPHDEN